MAQQQSFLKLKSPMLVEWALEMAKIGYGRTREQISEMVKRLLDKDGRLNPFVENRPGRDWWYGFLQRHPELSFRSPEHLQISRASACSKERLTRWYRAFKQFLKANGVKDPDQVWNADENRVSTLPQVRKSSCFMWCEGCVSSYRQ